MKRLLAIIVVAAVFLAGAAVGYVIFPTLKIASTVPVETSKPIVQEPIKPSIINNPPAVVQVPAPATNVPTPVAVANIPAPIPKPVVVPTPPSKSVNVPTPSPEPELKLPSQQADASGRCAIPSGAGAEDISKPTTTVGDGTAASCTAAKVVDAVHKGGVVTFNCGAAALAIKVPEIKIYNNGGKGDGSVTIDGGNKITLAAEGANRIIYQNTCDESLVWTSPRCDIQSAPHLVLQNIALADGRGAAGKGSLHDMLGGGAVYVRGGTFKAYDIKVADSVQTNASGVTTQDLAGGAIYTFGLAKPATIVNSVFENNYAANGGALGGLFTSYTIVNSTFTGNQATGHGENPARSGTTGGGLGGAIYNDGNSYNLNICGSTFTNNTANELGSGSIFMVANDLKGKLTIDQSTFKNNSNNGSVQNLKSIYVEAQDKRGVAGVVVTGTVRL
jgi:hypothetical protein